MIRGLAVVLFALSAFFIFYTVRLLVVRGGLAHTRPCWPLGLRGLVGAAGCAES